MRQEIWATLRIVMLALTYVLDIIATVFFILELKGNELKVASTSPTRLSVSAWLVSQLSDEA
jgi:hypothetical protein